MRTAAFVDQPVPWDDATEEKLERERADAEKKLKIQLKEVKGRYYWEPGRSVSLNFAMTGIPMFRVYNLGGFSGMAYNSRTGVLTVNPEWRTTREEFTSYGWAPLADKMIQIVKQSPRIVDVVNENLDKAEVKLGFKLEQGVRQEIVRWCEKAAERRLSVHAFPAPKGKEFVVAQPTVAIASELVKVAKVLVGDVSQMSHDEAVEVLGDIRHLYTDYGAMQLKSKREKMYGDKYSAQIILSFDKLVYAPHWTASDVLRRMSKSDAVLAFVDVVESNISVLKKGIIERLESKVPMERIVGWDEADDFDNVTGRVVNVRIGNFSEQHGELCVEGDVIMTVEARRLPDLVKGVYNTMSDVELKSLVQRWAEYAPEDFWMDGEYRGSASARIRQLMQMWRGMTPRKQQKHYDDLQRIR